MTTYKCPWCSTKASTKLYLHSHMRVCSRAPASYKSTDSTDFSLRDSAYNSIIELTPDTYSAPSYSGGGDFGGGGASSSWSDSSSLSSSSDSSSSSSGGD
jgi:uncharacterized membrane protein YgcG